MPLVNITNTETRKDAEREKKKKELTIPPILAPGAGSTAKNNPVFLIRSFNSIHPTPGCTTTSMSSSCNATISRMRSKLTHTPPFRLAVSAPPKLVPPENEVTAIRRSLQACRITDVCCVLMGKTTARGVSCGGAGECLVLALASRSCTSSVHSILWLDKSAIKLSMFVFVWLYVYSGMFADLYVGFEVGVRVREIWGKQLRASHAGSEIIPLSRYRSRNPWHKTWFKIVHYTQGNTIQFIDI
jgi:hypothetical protein